MNLNQVVVAVIALLSLYAPPVEACVGLGCMDPWTSLPRPGQAIPANVPALGLFSPGALDERVLDRLSLVQFVRDGGQAIDFDLDAGTMLVLRPKAPLPAGETVVLRYPPLCFGFGADAGTERTEVPIVVTAAAPLPSTLGTLTIQKTGLEQIPVNASVTCGTNLRAAYTDLSFTPDPALVPFLPVTGWTLTVDGTPWAVEEIGTVLADGTLLPVRQYPGQYHEARRILRVHAACGATGEGVDHGVSPGHFVARLEGTLLGTNTTLSAEQTIDLRCGPFDQRPAGAGCACGSVELPGLTLLALAPLLPRRRRRA